jgi:hypothetical protein
MCYQGRFIEVSILRTFKSIGTIHMKPVCMWGPSQESKYRYGGCGGAVVPGAAQNIHHEGDSSVGSLLQYPWGLFWLEFTPKMNFILITLSYCFFRTHLYATH